MWIGLKISFTLGGDVTIHDGIVVEDGGNKVLLGQGNDGFDKTFLTQFGWLVGVLEGDIAKYSLLLAV